MKEVIDQLNDPTAHPWLKTAGGFVGWLWGTVSLSSTVLLVTLLWTAANLFFLIRDKYFRDPERLQRMATQAKATQEAREERKLRE